MISLLILNAQHCQRTVLRLKSYRFRKQSSRSRVQPDPGTDVKCFNTHTLLRNAVFAYRVFWVNCLLRMKALGHIRRFVCKHKFLNGCMQCRSRYDTLPEQVLLLVMCSSCFSVTKRTPMAILCSLS